METIKQAKEQLSTTQLADLKDLLKETDKQQMSLDVAMVRGWILDEIESRLTLEQFEEFLDEEVKV